MKRKDLRFGHQYIVRGHRAPWKYEGLHSYSAQHAKMINAYGGTELIALHNIVKEHIPTHYTLRTKVHFLNDDGPEVCLEAYPFLEQRRALIFDVETARQLRDQLSLVLDSFPVD